MVTGQSILLGPQLCFTRKADWSGEGVCWVFTDDEPWLKLPTDQWEIREQEREHWMEMWLWWWAIHLVPFILYKNRGYAHLSWNRTNFFSFIFSSIRSSPPQVLTPCWSWWTPRVEGDKEKGMFYKIERFEFSYLVLFCLESMEANRPDFKSHPSHSHLMIWFKWLNIPFELCFLSVK